MSIYPSEDQVTEWFREYIKNTETPVHVLITRKAAEHAAKVCADVCMQAHNGESLCYEAIQALIGQEVV